jgi:hypothetical protein
MCPSFSFFVLRYSSACGLGSTSQGTRSTTSTPARCSASTFSGLFESSRTLLTHLPGQGKVALVGFETEALVGLDGVETRILQLIRLQFRHQTNAAAFLLFVNQDARTLVPNHSQCHFKLLPAVAAQRVKHIAGEALRVNADQRRRGMNITHHQGNSFLDPRGRARTGFCAKAIDPEPAPTRGKIRGCEWLKWISAHSLIIAACSRVATTPGGFNRAP